MESTLTALYDQISNLTYLRTSKGLEEEVMVKIISPYRAETCFLFTYMHPQRSFSDLTAVPRSCAFEADRDTEQQAEKPPVAYAYRRLPCNKYE